MLFWCCLTALAANISANREFDVLTETQDLRVVLHEAGMQMRPDLMIELAGVQWHGSDLIALAAAEPDEPITRLIRERTKRAVDTADLRYFLDDVIYQQADLPDEVVLPAGRARSAGLLIHPNDVYRKNKPRRYGRTATIAIDRPKPQQAYEPATDGALLGPEWTMRYRNPAERVTMLGDLHRARPDKTFPSRLASLLWQLEIQGVEVYVTSAVRSQERGYLMWGAFSLSRAKSEADLKSRLETVEDRNQAWSLNVPIQWRHPDGWQATREAARQMADAYDVVYATEQGARNSNHYGGRSVDFVALGLPRELKLWAPDGADFQIDLSDPVHPRDLSLEPAIVEWIEEHFGMVKLRSDYPHWSDKEK